MATAATHSDLRHDERRAYALDYTARGWRVFPAPPGTKKSYKKGEDHGGRRWGNTIDPAEVANDWARWPHANVGIACGPESGLFVIEADTIEGHGVDGLASLASLAQAHGGLPETIEALSPSGSRHLYFRWPDGLDIRNSEGRIAPGVDVRGAGGMVIAPPSVKPGKQLPYRWEKAPGIYELAPCPEWLVRLCMPKEKLVHDAAGTGSSRTIASDVDEQVLGWLYTRPNSLSRTDWVRLCFALKGSIGERARDAWLSFSSRYGGSTTEGEAKRQWETAVPDGQVGIGTAVHLLGGYERHAPSPGRSSYSIGDQAKEPEEGSPEAEPEDAPAPKKRPVGLTDFFAYMPTHTYIFAPTGEFWPGASVNSRIPPVPLFDNDNRPVLNKKDEPVELAANQWIDQHRPVEQMTWAPGHPQVVKDRLISDGGWIERSGCNVFNLYRPPLKAEGDATKADPWIDHVRRVYPDDADHIISWLAHRAQRPAEKINHAIVMGGCQGVGKDTILEPIKAAIGPWNFQEVSPQQMLGRFTGFAKSIILRISEARDLGDVDRFAFYDHTKVYTAAPPDVLRVDEKHIREYSVFNVCGVIITSNHKTDGIYLPADDRRHYVAWSDLSRDTFGADYWNTLYSWYHDGGIGHVVAYLRHLDISGFDAKAPPKKTAAFWDIVSSNQAPEEAELSDALESLGWPNAVTVASVALYAADAFKDFLLDRRNSRRIPHRFEECGYVQVRNSNAQDGLYKVSGKRCVIYAKKVLSRRDQIAAAERLAYPGGQPGQ
jgi:hypothetical protein